ncbi:MAG: serine/threonine protein kinase, partial [Myxococcales bacterium]
MHPTFGRYELLKRLAGGGMGEVYLARQRGIDGFSKLLVIKTLLPHLCEDEEFITMFKDEARVTAQLIHPNICQVFEFEQVGGVYYMAMEYLRGEDLRRLWKACEQRGTPLRVPLICRVISDAAAGLDFAHSLRDSKGEPYHIVHRDISPQNILVTFEGGVKVIDFGVAKAAGRAQHTRTGALKGKYSYMSPEQVAGAEVDGRSDIFALGIVLHELLTGRRLFKADSDVQTLARVRECNVAPPSRLNPQL